jgi:hypothetical protein
MDRESRDNRTYKTTKLPTLREGVILATNRDLMLNMYDQACQTWRELVGVRFRLLAIVPSVSLLLLATVLSSEGPGKGLTVGLKILFSILGLFVTAGLLIYDLRNSMLHDDLISRARKIEDELGVDTGVFRGRLKAGRVIQHDNATRLIYGATLAGWFSALIYLCSSWFIWRTGGTGGATMPISEMKDIATIVGVLVAATSLAFAAINTRLTLRSNRARFWLDLRDRFAKHDAVHRRLRPKGAWTEGSGPATPEEWAEVEAYMGLFEHCEVMLHQRLIDEKTFREIYAYRLNNLVANDVIRNEKLVLRAEGWQRFLALLRRMKIELKESKGVAAA